MMGVGDPITFGNAVEMAWGVENRPNIPNMDKFTHWRVSLTGMGPMQEIMVPLDHPDMFQTIFVQDGTPRLTPLQPLPGLRKVRFPVTVDGVYVGRVQLSSADQSVLDFDNILVFTPIVRTTPTVPVPVNGTATLTGA